MTTPINQVAALLERERDHLRTAHRAQRDALEAEFFGDEVTCHNRLVDAREATYAALICADEVADLMGIAARLVTTTNTQEEENNA